MNDNVIQRPTVMLRGKTFYIEMTRYSDNGNTCIVLLNGEGGVEYKVTANLGPLKPQFCYIKDYSENKGMSVAMKKYLTATGQFKHSGHVRFHQYAIADELLAMAGIEVRTSFSEETELETPNPFDDPSDPLAGDEVPDVSFEDAEAASAAYEEGSEAAELGPDFDDPRDEGLPADATAGVGDDPKAPQ